MAEEFIRNNTGRLGEWIPEATSPNADPNEYGDDARYRYESDAHTNWAEKQYQDDLAALQKAAGEDGNTHGTFLTVRKVEF